MFSCIRSNESKRKKTFSDVLIVSIEKSSRKSPGRKIRRILDTINFTRALKREGTVESEEHDAVPEEPQCQEDSNAVVSLLLDVRLKSGDDLPVKDTSGSSDPYVKFKYKDTIVYKSSTIFKNLNPVWDEEFQMITDDINAPFRIEVFDFDRFCADDFMGTASLDLTHIKWETRNDIELKLEDESGEQAGSISIAVSIQPLTLTEAKEFMMRSTKGVIAANEKRKEKPSQVWKKVVNIVVVEARGFISNNPLDVFCKFKIGMEKYKTKTCSSTKEPKWLEQFDLHVYEGNEEQLQIICVDRNTNETIGKLSIDIEHQETDQTLQKWYELEGAYGAELLLLITVSGEQQAVSQVDFADFNFNDVRNTLIERYDLPSTLTDMQDVGVLNVKVFCAEDLQAADFGGKSDPFVVVELVNTRLQTHTEYKTLNPEWNKLFTFQVKDIHTCLEVTVFDEDPNKKFEFLGKVSIPLLSIRNCERRWYALKDRKLRQRVKGEILLEMDIIWNPIRAAVRTLNPKEQKFIQHEQKFKASMFRATVMEVKEFAVSLIDFKDSIFALFDWENKYKSAVAFVSFIIVVYNFEVYHIPLILLAIFAKNYTIKKLVETDESRPESPKNKAEDDDNQQSTSIKDTFFSVQETLGVVQNSLVFATKLIQRVKRTFDFTNLWLSTMAVIILTIAFVILYLVPLRWLVMLWGINKFTKKLRNPNFEDNNEILDFLSRVPCDAEMIEWKNDKILKPTSHVHVQSHLKLQNSNST